MSNFLEKRISVKTLFIIIAFFLIFGSVILYFTFGGITEGFQAGLVGIGSALNYKIGDGVKSSWENKGSNNDSDSEGTLPGIVDIKSSLNMISSEVGTSIFVEADNIFAKLETNEGGQVPLPEGELVFFNKTKFSPECCPSSYSSSAGCACASPEQMKYLNERGGNRTLTSVY